MLIVIDKSTKKILANYGTNSLFSDGNIPKLEPKEEELFIKLNDNSDMVKKILNSYEYELILNENNECIDIDIIKPLEDWQKEQSKIEPQPTKEERINAKILKDNAEIHLELEKQKQINAKLLLQVAELGGNK